METRRSPRAPNTPVPKRLFIYLNFVNGGNEKRVTVQSKRREMMNLEQHVCNKADQGKAFCLRCKVIGWRFDRVALASRESFPFQLREPTCSLASCIGLAANGIVACVQKAPFLSGKLLPVACVLPWTYYHKDRSLCPCCLNSR